MTFDSVAGIQHSLGIDARGPSSMTSKPKPKFNLSIYIPPKLLYCLGVLLQFRLNCIAEIVVVSDNRPSDIYVLPQ